MILTSRILTSKDFYYENLTNIDKIILSLRKTAPMTLTLYIAKKVTQLEKVCLSLDIKD